MSKIDPAVHAKAATIIQRGLLDAEAASAERAIREGRPENVPFNRAYLDICQRLTKVCQRIIAKETQG